MKKITFCMIAVLFSFAASAQDSCAEAIAVTEGITTVGTIDGELPNPECMDSWMTTAGEWYSYTATEDVVVTVNTDLPVNTGVDTRVSIYEGTCDALTCYAYSDDVGETNFLSNVQFVAYAGQTYTIAFDDNWDENGFDFELTTSTDIPTEAPNAATNPMPADGAVDVEADENDMITVSWQPSTTGGEANVYNFYLGFAEDDLYLIGGVSAPNYTFEGLPEGEEVFWKVVPVNALGEAENVPVWSFTTVEIANNGSSCEDAIAVTEGITTVETLTGEAPNPQCFEGGSEAGAWFSYTATEQILVTVSSDLPQNTGDFSDDTRLMVYQGTCEALTCFAQNDDSGEGYLSEVQFVAEAGETYYFVFDDYWSNAGFDFELTTSTDIPEIPEQAMNPTPEDGAVNVPLDLTNDAYAVEFAWEAPTTGSPATSYDFYLGLSEESIELLGNTPNTDVYLPDFEYNTTYYWMVVPRNARGEAETAEIWSFTTEDDLSVDGPAANEISYFYNTESQSLEIKVETSLDYVSVYSLTGKQVLRKQLKGNEASVDMSSLGTGLYLAKFSVNGKSGTIKFVKQ